MSLRAQLIRLAHTHPELRDDLLPLLKVGKLMSRQEAILKRHVNSLGTGQSVLDYDDLPPRVVDDLVKVKDSETLWSDVNRWLADNDPHHGRWASVIDPNSVSAVMERVIDKAMDLAKDRGADLNNGGFLRLMDEAFELVPTGSFRTRAELSKAHTAMLDQMEEQARIMMQNRMANETSRWSASSKVAAGPDRTGRNWKERDVSGITHWIWEGSPNDTIQRFTVIEQETPSGMIYYMTVKLNDGTLLRTVGEKLEEAHWFKRAAEIYRASQGYLLDFSNMPELWKNLTPGLSKNAAWENLPKGWTQDSVKKMWDTMTEGVKHKITKCMEKMEGKVTDTGAYCGSLAAQVGYKRASDRTAEWKGWTEDMPVQVVMDRGAKVFPNLAAAQKVFPTLSPTRGGRDFTWAMRGEVNGRPAIRFETISVYRSMSRDASVLRTAMIRVAHENPSLRAELLPYITRNA